jgi:hypothetical protein
MTDNFLTGGYGMTRYYKWMADGKPVYGKRKYATPGKWQTRIRGELVPCKTGYHVLTAEQVPSWCGTELIEVEIKGVVIVQDDKCVCRTWREVKRYQWTRDDMIAYAQWCASRAEEHFARAARASGAAARAAVRAAAYAASDAADAASDAARAAYASGASHASSEAAVAAAASAAYAASAAHASYSAAAAHDSERNKQREWIEKRIGEPLG